MSEYSPSPALLRSLGRYGADPRRDAFYASGQGTRAATQPHLRHAAATSADRVVSAARRHRVPPEERQKEISRRRTWGGGGNLPDKVRACYTEAERAALSVIGEQCKHKGYCDRSIDEIARIAGVSRTSVQNAIRKARSKENAHISVRERRPERGLMSGTNIIRITCKLWIGWITRALGFKAKGGFKRLNTSETTDRISLSKSVESSKWAFEKEEEAGRSATGCNEYQRRRSGWDNSRHQAPINQHRGA